MNGFLLIDLENVNAEYIDIFEVIGANAFFNLSKEMGGTHIYIPKVQKAYKEEIKSYILNNYNGKNKRKLAIGFGISEKTVQNILNKGGKTRTTFSSRI